jgi:hypothetical protein
MKKLLILIPLVLTSCVGAYERDANGATKGFAAIGTNASSINFGSFSATDFNQSEGLGDVTGTIKDINIAGQAGRTIRQGIGAAESIIP